MTSSKLIIKSIAQKVMAKFGFGRKFHDLKYLEFGIFFLILEFIINLRETIQIFVKKNQFDVILSCFKQI